MQQTNDALSGLRVVDLSTYLPGPYASMMLADLGADVLHIEPPGGDPSRHLEGRVGGDSALHWWVTRNKRSLVLDLKDASDRERLLGLVAEADVVLESFRPGVAARLGVDYEACRRVNDGIIYCAVTSYGQSGRSRDVPAHDLNYSAKAGVLGLSLDGDGQPVMVGFPVTDVVGGLHAAVGVLAAYVHRSQTGEGQYVDSSILAASVGLVGMQLMKALGGSPPCKGEDMNMGGDPAYGLYATKDGHHLSIACLEDKFWHRLCALIERPDLETLRRVDPSRAHTELAVVFATRELESWDALLVGEDVCYGRVNAIDEVADDPDVIDSGLVTTMTDGEGRTWPQLRNPLNLSRTPPTLRTPAPPLGGNPGGWREDVSREDTNVPL